MTPQQLYDELLDLARSAGFEIRRSSGGVGGDTHLPLASGVCRVRGAIWVILSASDSIEERSDALVEALITHATALLEERYLPPAVRDRLSG